MARDQITFEFRRDTGLHANEYTVVSQDQDRKEVQLFTFYVTDKGMIWNISKPEDVPT